MTPEEACAIVDSFDKETGYFLEIARTLRQALAETLAERDVLNPLLHLEVNGHHAPCVICDKSCDALAGNPSLWPVRLGNDGWRHVGCVNNRLAERDAALAKLAKFEEQYGKDLEQLDKAMKVVEAARPLRTNYSPYGELPAVARLREALAALADWLEKAGA